MLQWASALTHCRTGGIRTRDLGIDSAVIPTAFATGNQNFSLFKSRAFKNATRSVRFRLHAVSYSTHGQGRTRQFQCSPTSIRVFENSLSLLPSIKGPRLRTNNWCDRYSLDVITPAFLRRRRSTLRVVAYKASSSINPTQWSAPNAPAANKASTLNTSSVKPPMFKISDRSSACVWA